MVDWNKAQVDQKKWNVDNDKLKKIEESVEDMTTTSDASLLQSTQRVRQGAEDSTTDPDDSIDADFGQAISGLGDLKDLPQSTVSSVGTSLKQAMVDWNKAQVDQKKWNVDNDKLKKIEESVEDMTTTTSDASLLMITQRVRQGAEDSTTDPDDSIDADFGQATSGLGDLKDLPQSTLTSVGTS